MMRLFWDYWITQWIRGKDFLEEFCDRKTALQKYILSKFSIHYGLRCNVERQISRIVLSKVFPILIIAFSQLFDFHRALIIIILPRSL